MLKLTFTDGECKLIGRLTCKHKLCASCQKRRGGRLAHEMGNVLDFLKEAWGFGPGRIRFATFTIPNVDRIDEGFDWIAEAWHKALSGKAWGKMIAGGFRCFEVKPGKDEKWNVHLHAILCLWNPEVSYKKMHEIWDRSTGVEKANLRFDQLRKVKGRNGRSKAQAVAAYIAKYLVKFEDLAGCAKAPGGLAHLADALQGRRMWSAWGIAATARKWWKLAKPEWMNRAREWINGYRSETGAALERSEVVDTLTGEALPVEARPWTGLFGGEPPDMLQLPPDALAFTWWSAGPLPIFRTLGKWIGWRRWWQDTTRERKPTRYRLHFAAIYRPLSDTEPSNYGHLDYSPSPQSFTRQRNANLRRTFNGIVHRLGWPEAGAWMDRLPDHLRPVLTDHYGGDHARADGSIFTF